MNRTERIVIVLIVLVLCVVFLFPTFKWYGLTSSEDKILAEGSNVQIREYSRGQATRILNEFKELELTDSIPESENWMGFSTVGDFYDEYSSETARFNYIENYFRTYYQELKKSSSKALQLGLDLKGGMSILLDTDKAALEERLGREVTDTEVNTAILEDVEILKNRIDQFGLSEPEIRRQGTNQILVEIAGTPDQERVNSFLRGKGALAFHLVDSSETTYAQKYFEQHPSELYDEAGRIVQPDFISESNFLAGRYQEDEYGIDELVSIVVLNKEVALDGEHLESALVGSNSITGQPEVDFHLDAEGGEIFYKFTKAHVNELLAIVMDGKVKSVATISKGISADVSITGFNQTEAESLAIVLKTASLPIPVSVASQKVVGATLGEDAVQIGLKAIIIGLALVVVFMFAYYGLSGLVANLALLINMLIMFATLSGFSFTLTLTGIAGVILTLGMAVDANVIIFESMKEELDAGMPPKSAVKAGFGKAFWTILDANITTIIAGIVLSQLGSSSVKGFANTLIIGIISSLFTALFLSHLIFDLSVKNKLHIGWRRK